MLEQLLEVLKNSEADAWEIDDRKINGWEFYYIKHQLDQNRIRKVRHINLTIYKYSDDKQFIGNASQEIAPTLSMEEIKKVVNDLVYRASLVKNKAYSINQKTDNTNDEKDIDVKTIAKDFLNTLNDINESEEADINSYEIFVDEIERHFLNSNGIDIKEKYPSSMVEVVVNARNEKHEIELYRLYNSGTCDKNQLKKDINKTLEYGKDRLHTQPTPNMGKCALILSTSDAIQVYDYFVSRLNAGLIYQKLSNWKLNEKICEAKGDKVSIEAKKYLANSNANHNYDSQGHLIEDKTLIKENVPMTYYGNQMFRSYMDIDGFMITNYVVDGGSKSEDEIRSGKYLEVVEFSDFQVSAVTGDIFGEIRLGYYHDGDKIIPVSGGSVSGSMFEYMKEMYMSKDCTQYNNVVIPSLTKLMNVTVTGLE